MTVNHVTVMVQPQGALLNFGAQNPQSGARKGWTLVVDAGGGTLDWFVSQGRVPNWARSGAYPKSMLACAYAVADQIDPDYKNQFEVIEIIDEAIRHRSESFKLAGDEYQMSQFQSSIDAVLRESVDAMLSTIESTAAVSTVLMTGGGAKVFPRGSELPVVSNPYLLDMLRQMEETAVRVLRCPQGKPFTLTAHTSGGRRIFLPLCRLRPRRTCIGAAPI